MLIKVGQSADPKAKDRFAYYDMETKGSLCYGRICTIAADEIEVDFGDIVMAYVMADIIYVYDTKSGEEHFATYSLGHVVADYR